MTVGPTIQEDLIFLITRFRLHNIVITTNFKKTYRQTKIDESDAKYQKILWRENQNANIRVLQLDTVTQGTASAPYLAAETLQKLIDDEGINFPCAAASLRNDFYVDDFLDEASKMEKAITLKEELTKLLKLGGFELHKWASNE